MISLFCIVWLVVRCFGFVFCDFGCLRFVGDWMIFGGGFLVLFYGLMVTFGSAGLWIWLVPVLVLWFCFVCVAAAWFWLGWISLVSVVCRFIRV